MNQVALPDGMDLSELNDRLAEWIKFHHETLMVCSYHALSLPTDIGRTSTHIFRVIVEPRTDHGGNPAKYFRVTSASAPLITEAAEYDEAWASGISVLKQMREDSERAGRGTETAVGIECDPLTVQLVPFGSIFAGSESTQLEVLPHWEDILKKDIEQGNRVSAFRT